MDAADPTSKYGILSNTSWTVQDKWEGSGLRRYPCADVWLDLKVIAWVSLGKSISKGDGSKIRNMVLFVCLYTL